MIWTFEDKEFTSEDIGEYLGFIYEVRNRKNGMIYIGQKRFWSVTTRPPLKGQKRKRKVTKESDWKKYCGSSESVKLLVEEHGLEIFDRRIISLCMTKGEMNYLELKQQMDTDALLKPNTYYNAFVGGKINRSHLKSLFLE